MALPVRKPIRLQDYDYTTNGAYFVTVCTHKKQRLFWDGNTPNLNGQGQLILFWIKELSNHFPGLYTDCYSILPNHIHLVLFLQNATTDLPTVLEWWKTMTTNAYIRAVKHGQFPPFDRRIWQRSFYEHIIRSEAELYEVRKYVVENPEKWHLDSLY